jgi:putative transposase
MKKSRFSEEQITYALKQADGGTPVADICRQLGVSEASFYHWRKKYGELGISGMHEVRQLREENARLKRLVADLTLDKHILGEVIRKKSEARPSPDAGVLDYRALSRQHAESVPTGSVFPIGILPRQHEARPLGTAAAYPGHRARPSLFRLSTNHGRVAA